LISFSLTAFPELEVDTQSTISILPLRYLTWLSWGGAGTSTFEQAAAKFVLENQHKRSLPSDLGRLKLLMPWIGSIIIE